VGEGFVRVVAEADQGAICQKGR